MPQLSRFKIGYMKDGRRIYFWIEAYKITVAIHDLQRYPPHVREEDIVSIVKVKALSNGLHR